MEIPLTTNSIIFVIGVLGSIFTVYNYFKNPQIKSDKIDAILTYKFDMLEKSFNNLRDNHIHTLDTKIDETNKNLSCLSLEVGKLSTIIEERIPKK